MKRGLGDADQMRTLAPDLPDSLDGKIPTGQRRFDCTGSAGINRGEEAAGCLRIKKESAKFRRNIFREGNAAFDELAIVFHAGGEKAAPGRFHRAGKPFKAAMIEFE